MNNRIVDQELAKLRQEYDDILLMVEKYNLMRKDGMVQSASDYHRDNLAVLGNYYSNGIKLYKAAMYKIAQSCADISLSNRKHPFDYLSIGNIHPGKNYNEFPRFNNGEFIYIYSVSAYGHETHMNCSDRPQYWFNKLISDEIICRMSDKLVNMVDKDRESLKDLQVEVSELSDHMDVSNETTASRLSALESTMSELSDKVNALSIENHILRDEIARLNNHTGIQVEYNYEDIASRLDPIRGDLMHTQRIMIRNLRRREYSDIPMAIPVDPK